MPEERGWLGDSWAFTKSLGSGAWDAGAGLVEGVGELAKGGYALATDEKARESAWNTTKKLAKAAGEYGEEVWDDPAKAYRDARDGTLAAYNSFEQAKEKAEAEGRSAEFWGNLTGKGLFEVGTTLIPVGLAAKAGKLGKVAKGAKQLENAEDALSASKRAEAVVTDSVIKTIDGDGLVAECPLKEGVSKKPEGIAGAKNTLSVEALNTKLDKDAINHPKKTYGPAVSRGGAIDKNWNVINSDAFTNLDFKKKLLSDNPEKQIAGISKNADGKTFNIIDKDAYISDVEKLYKEKGIELQPDTKNLISNYIDRNSNFKLTDGPPGLHSEVQSLNQIYQKAKGADNIREINIGTKHTDETIDNFPACSNCSGIIKQDLNVNIFTDD